MLRVLSRFAAIMTLLWVVLASAASLIPLPESPAAQFYRAIFDCSSPCLMGIIPGVTTLVQADNTLHTHAWVGQIRMQRGMEYDSGIIEWAWSGAQPDFIEDSRNGIVYVGQGIVRSIDVTLRMGLGEVCLLSPPVGFERLEIYGRSVVFRGYYDPPEITVRTERQAIMQGNPIEWVRALMSDNVALRLQTAASLEQQLEATSIEGGIFSEEFICPMVR